MSYILSSFHTSERKKLNGVHILLEGVYLITERMYTVLFRFIFGVCDWYLIQIVLCYKISPRLILVKQSTKPKSFNTENKPDYSIYIWESLNSLDLRNGGVALYLENFNRLELLRSVP